MYSALISKICHCPGMPICNSEDLPEVDFDLCNPDVKLSEIQRIFITRTSAPDFGNILDPGEWQARISEDSMNAYAMRMLTVIGDKPIPAAQKAKISWSRTKTIRKDHTINATIDEVTDANHEFIRSLKAGGSTFKFWYEIMGGLMFGGTTGITGKFFGDMVLARGAGEIMLYQVAIIWQNMHTESFFPSPVFGDITLAEPMPLATDDDVPLSTDAGDILFTD